jgi:hypothetical protein
MDNAKSALAGLFCLVVVICPLKASSVNSSNECDTAQSHSEEVGRAGVALLEWQAGLVDDSIATRMSSQALQSPMGELDSIYLRPRQMLENEEHDFSYWASDCDYPVLRYHFYANPGYISVTAQPKWPDQDVAFYLRSRGAYPQGQLLWSQDENGYGMAESGSYYFDGYPDRRFDPERFVLIVGFSDIEGCDPDWGGEYVDYITVSLDYTPAEWDLRLQSITTSNPYPHIITTITSAVKNHGWDTLYAEPPWDYTWDLFLNHSPKNCNSTPPDYSQTFTGVMNPGGTTSMGIDICCLCTGLMDVFAKANGGNDLPVVRPSLLCNASWPLQLLWSVDLTGKFSIWDALTQSWQNMPSFQFEVVRINEPETTLLASITTDANGNYSTMIPSGNDSIFYRLSTDQRAGLFPVRSYHTSDFLCGIYRTRRTATIPQISQNVRLNKDTVKSNTAFFPAVRVMRDLEITDSIISHFSPFSNPHLKLENEVLVYLDSLDVAGSFWGFLQDNPVIVVEQRAAPYQTACHELGHQIMYMLQGDTVKPCTPFDSLVHYRNSVTDTIFAYEEGFAEFIHAISSVPESLKTAGEHIETNTWWQGRDGDTGLTYAADSVEGCIASVFYDLYDSDVVPATRVIPEDDGVGDPSYMMQIMLDCMFNFRDSLQQTRSLMTFANRLVRDTNAQWYYDYKLDSLRDTICCVFRNNHFFVPYDFCRGSGILHDTADSPPETLPLQFSLRQNYPNPFNNGTQIGFVAPKEGTYIFRVYNILGQLVYTRGLPVQEPGEQTIALDKAIVESWSSGVYFYRLSSTSGTETKKMLYLK